MVDASHPEAASLTRRQFGDRARAYAASPLHSRDQSLDLMERLTMADATAASETRYRNVVDVGCGAGFTAVAMSSLARRVLATDFTSEMVQQARQVASERQADGMTALIAAASSLPVRTASVDLLTCRYAFHHMIEAQRVLAEFRRALAPGGSFLLADTVATEDPEVADWMDQAERLRDPSHHLNRSPSQLATLIEDCGFRITAKAEARVYLDLASWTERSGTPPREVATLRTMLQEAGPKVGEAFAIVVDGESIRFSWPCLVVRAVKADGE